MARSIWVRAVDKPELPAFEMPERFRLEIVYFMTPGDVEGAPHLGPREYWIETENVARWLDDGVFSIISPLDAETVAEIELTEDQERWLEWMLRHEVAHVKLETA